MNQQPTSQPTLRDLLRPIVAYKWLLAGVVLLAIAASLIYSETRKATYQSTAALAVHDENVDLSLLGLPITPTQTPDQIAAAAAQTIVQPPVARIVQQTLRSAQSPTALSNSVTATVQPSSNLVEITGTSSGAARARDLANAFASAGASALNTQQRLLYAASLRELKTRAPKGTGAAQRLYNQQITRLQVLSEIATPAQVVTPAPLPRSPTSPRPLRNALLAGALGLVIGLLIVYVRDAFDRRLRTAQDIAQELALPMLGHVRHDALGQSPRFNGSQAVSEIDWELFSIMRRNLDFLDERELARVVAVTSPLPEEGKSTVAAFLAFVSAAAGKRTLLIEGDLRRPVFAERLGITRAPGLSDYLAGQVRLEQVVQVVKFGDPAAVNGASSTDTADDGGSEPAVANELPRLHEHELGCIAAGTPTRHPVELLRSDRLRTMLAEVGTAYELVVVDTPPMLSVVDTLELLPEVDAVVVCVRMDKTTRQQAKAGRAALARLPRRPTGLVVTGTRPANDAEYGYYAYES